MDWSWGLVTIFAALGGFGFGYVYGVTHNNKDINSTMNKYRFGLMNRKLRPPASPPPRYRNYGMHKDREQ